MTTKQLPPHGSLSRHKWHGCKCRTCYDGYNRWQAERHAAKRAGTYVSLVDAEPVRRHILRLQAVGISAPKIARHLGYSPASIVAFIRQPAPGRPRKRRTRPETAARILAVTLADIVPGVTDPIGSHRRIQALAAIGWPLKALGPHIGVHPSWVDDILRRQVIRGSTARAVEETYVRLASGRPERHGVDKGLAKRARNRAAALRWAPPRYWDRFPGAIDDPHFTPEYGLTKPQRLAEEAVWMVTVAGVARTEAAARLGLTFGEVDDALARNDMRKAA